MNRCYPALAQFLIVMLLVGCDQVSEEPAPSEPITEMNPVSLPVRVSTIYPEQVDLVEPINVTGTVLAIKTTKIVPLVGGLVEEVFVRVGDHVTKGQPLLRMRKRDFQVKVERFSHALKLAEAERRNASNDLRSAQALAKKHALSQEQLDDRETRFEATTARVGIAKANLEEAQQEMHDSITTAPFDGSITQRNVDEGAYIASIMRSGQPVLEIQKIDIMVAVVYVPETHLRSIHLGTKGTVRIPGLGKTFDSEVHLINDRIDMDTRSIDVRLGIPNPDYEIKPGLFIEVDLQSDPRMGMVLPDSVVNGFGSDRYVYVAEDGVAHKRAVTLRELNDNRIEVLTGLSQTDKVIYGADLSQLQDQALIVAVDAG